MLPRDSKVNGGARPELCGLGQCLSIRAAGQVPENQAGQTESHIPEG